MKISFESFPRRLRAGLIGILLLTAISQLNGQTQTYVYDGYVDTA
jgi:hypothetical protein